MACNRRAKILRINHQKPISRPHSSIWGQHDDLSAHQIRFLRVGLAEPVQATIGNLYHDGTDIVIPSKCTASQQGISLGCVEYRPILSIEINMPCAIA